MPACKGMEIFAISLLPYKVEPFNCHSRREMYKINYIENNLLLTVLKRSFAVLGPVIQITST